MLYAVKLDRRINVDVNRTRRSLLVTRRPTIDALKSHIERLGGEWIVVTAELPEVANLLRNMTEKQYVLWRAPYIRTFLDPKWESTEDRYLIERFKKYEHKRTVH